MGMDMDMSATVETPSTAPVDDAPMNYFRYGHYGGWMYAHVVLMIFGWAFVMPVSLVLSVARSRYHLPAQVLFHTLNGLGVFTSFVYNHSTPDLYKHNSHHPIGWVVTSFTIAWTLMSFFVAYGEYKSKRQTGGSHSMTTQAMARHNFFHRYRDHNSSRSSRDSGQGTERNSASLMGSRQNSQDSVQYKPEEPVSPMQDVAFDNDDDDAESEKHGLLGNNRVDRFISRHVHRFSTPRASKIVRSSQIVVEKVLLLLGFLAGTTGFVVWGGIFRDRMVFSGLAHFIKGGIFFWYGILTLGRWMGAFGEFGWAWNVRPNYPLVSRWKTRIPSAEFVESFVIWAYGASNVFLEHLNNWGKAWSPQDFEHVSITILFFGGGLLGMMIESSWARELMNTSVVVQRSEADGVAFVRVSRFHTSGENSESAAEAPAHAHQLWEQPKTYHTSLNPLPGLVIMLLGIMMSAHHQESMVSTMMHSQWGTLFVGFAMARAATYVLLYIKPPTSHFPARPPSELVAAFCLTAGGLMFMFSARGTVQAIEQNGLDAMTIFTLTMGLSAAILAWEVLVFTLKGWAVRKERAAAGKPVI
jgi:hypothetical protein